MIQSTPKPSSRHRLFKIISILLFSIASTSLYLYSTRFDPFGTAQAAFDRRETGTALNLADSYLKTHPKDPRASLLAARCMTRLGEVEAAERYYQVADPREQADLQARAFGLLKLNRPDRALPIYEAIIKSWPDDIVSLQRLGSIQIGRKAWKEVLKVADRLIRIPEGEIAGETMRATALYESNRYRDAAKAFERVIELDPELKTMPLPKPLFQKNHASSLLAEGRTADARRMLTAALQESLDASLLDLLGRSYLMDDQPESAEKCWLKGIEVDEKLGDNWLDLGQLASRRKQWPEAIRFLRRASELDPSRVEGHYALGIALRNQGNRDEADRESAIAAKLRAQSNQPTGGNGR